MAFRLGTVTLGRRFTVAVRLTMSVRLAMPGRRTMRIRAMFIGSTVGILCPMAGIRAMALGNHHFGLHAIRLVVKPRDQRLDVGLLQGDLLAVKQAIGTGGLVDVAGSEHLAGRTFGNPAWIRNIDDIGADGASAHRRTVGRSALVEHHDLHEIRLVLFIDGTCHPKGRLDAAHAVARLIGGNVFADPETVLLLDHDGLDLGAFEPVELGIGRPENLVGADEDGCSARGAAKHQYATKGETDLSRDPDLAEKTLHVVYSNINPPRLTTQY